MATDDAKKNAPMPPGMVMGPDGKPCKICTAFRNWTPRTIESDQHNKSRTDQTSKHTSATAMMAALAGGATTKASTSTSPPVGPPPGCPPDVEQLGNATWTFLHTTAAYYPDKPTPQQRANMVSLLRALPLLYPCTWCAKDFGENMDIHPPMVSSRTALSQWLCERHNEVNEKLGKDIFDCAMVDERWKDGPADGRCG